MTVRKDEQGHRSVEAEVEVPGSPEDVWRAIATGKGISSWFVPTKVEEREGGETVSDYGGGMESVGKITAWDPPRKYVAKTDQEGLGEVATEWIVEARGGGKCVVRVVHRWFADTDDWDAQFEGHAYGWTASFFRVLRVYLADFAEQECAAFQITAFSQEPGPQTWRTLKGALLIDHAAARVVSAPGAPGLAGVIESLEVSDPELLRIRETAPHIAAAFEGMQGENPELFVRLDRPCPGFAHAFIVPMGGPTMVSVRFHLFGAHASGVAAQYESDWQAWLEAQFPACEADGPT